MIEKCCYESINLRLVYVLYCGNIFGLIDYFLMCCDVYVFCKIGFVYFRDFFVFFFVIVLVSDEGVMNVDINISFGIVILFYLYYVFYRFELMME